ncbi:hypothetical protein [Actinoplanes xinjiangensis]|uniref:FtsX-like permease family protein n=1 Tax=Actinoplanes xinjiangensis TaxID=512350 RepID=A0A316FBN1_9ACTN|nr:hypothetical protein [Actinoplanes xinjiangensis]PWK46264.1 hypothetical protein BC793_110258 [Actinoplanes xinjiangensis]GIF40799.1 hypothetical protein Axi01nite_51100 [Actinoplanes xinjiangensis]
MRFRSILSEAGRNLATGTSRALLFALLLAAITAGAAIMDARSIIGVQSRAADFVASGASIRVMVAPAMTDAAACERLGTIGGIRAAGALREADAVVLRTMNANPVPAYAVTPGLIAVLGGDPAAPAGAWLPAPLARTLGVQAGQELPTGSGTLTVAGLYEYPDDGRDSRLAYAALLPQPAAGSFDECWADIWPLSRDREQLLHAALAVDSSAADAVAVGQLNTSRGTRFDALGEFTARPTRFALPACALAGLLLGLIAVRIRRLELAAALHLGASRRDVLAIQVIETAAWAAAGVVLAAVALLAGVVAAGSTDAAAVYLVDVRGPAVAACATLIGAVLGVLTVRERHLFRYFKNR